MTMTSDGQDVTLHRGLRRGSRDRRLRRWWRRRWRRCTGAAGERLGRRVVPAVGELRRPVRQPTPRHEPGQTVCRTPTSKARATDENNWLRSWSNELYLWYNEIIDRDPGLYTTPEYFGDILRTSAIDAVRQPQRSLPLHLPDFGLARARAIGHGSRVRRGVVRRLQHAAAADRRGLYTSELARDRAGSQPATRRGSVVHRWRRRRQHQHASHGRHVRCRALPGSAGRESHVRAAQSSDGLAANRHADVRERDDRSGAERQHDRHANRQRRLHTVQRSPPGRRAAAHRRVRATGRSERHGSRSRPALQRRRFAGDRQRGRLHDRRHGADGRADVRAPALQRQAHGHQPDHRRSR